MEYNNYVTQFISAWDSPSDTLVSTCHQIISLMVKDPSIKSWLSEQLGEKESLELYRDKKHGFVLTAYTEKFEQYRVPHNHGNGWVIYSVVNGKMEMGSYDKNISLINSDILNSGDSRVYLPGDIHDTRCLSLGALLLRFTSCDLKIEEKEGRMKKFTF
ncbi:MAG: hypothetical protein AB7I27_12320 [Bacteriovoracaceae bacterium]